MFRTKARRSIRSLGSKKSSNETSRFKDTCTTGAVLISTGSEPLISCKDIMYMNNCYYKQVSHNFWHSDSKEFITGSLF